MILKKINNRIKLIKIMMNTNFQIIISLIKMIIFKMNKKK